MKTARKTFPDLVAINSMRNANDPANTVPNPLFSPLHKVAPVKTETKFKYIVCSSRKLMHGNKINK